MRSVGRRYVVALALALGLVLGLTASALASAQTWRVVVGKSVQPAPYQGHPPSFSVIDFRDRVWHPRGLAIRIVSGTVNVRVVKLACRHHGVTLQSDRHPQFSAADNGAFYGHGVIHPLPIVKNALWCSVMAIAAAPSGTSFMHVQLLAKR